MFKKYTCFVPICDLCSREIESGDYIPHHASESEAADAVLESGDGEMLGEQLVCHSCWKYNLLGRTVKEENLR